MRHTQFHSNKPISLAAVAEKRNVQDRCHVVHLRFMIGTILDLFLITNCSDALYKVSSKIEEVTYRISRGLPWMTIVTEYILLLVARTRTKTSSCFVFISKTCTKQHHNLGVNLYMFNQNSYGNLSDETISGIPNTIRLYVTITHGNGISPTGMVSVVFVDRWPLMTE